MSFYPNFRQMRFDEIVDGASSSKVSDVAYDARAFKKFPSKLPGIKIYISPFPFVNRDCKEQNPNLFIDEAISNGANVVIYRPDRKIIKNKKVAYIEHDNPRELLARAAGRWYQTSSLALPTFGVTGTSGKTTTVYMLHHILNKLVGTTGLTSSADYYIGNRKYRNFTPVVNQTLLSCPEALELSGFMDKHRRGLKAFVVEATSHALALDRASLNLSFAGGIITNIGSEHLDFHKTHENYVRSKLKLIKLIAESNFKIKKVVLNADDKYFRISIKEASHYKVNVATVGFEKPNLLKNKIDYLIRNDNYKYLLQHNNKKVFLPDNIRSGANAANAAMAAALVHQYFGGKLENIVKLLNTFRGVSGRFEVLTKNPFTVMVDNAHEPLSFEMVLKYARSLWKDVITVFSCTGDRDGAKRPIMGRLAAKLSDYTIITNDSTHGENPQKILAEIEKGFLSIKKDKYEVIDDREKAIRRGVKMGKPNGVVLILGVGSENIIERGGRIKKWSDKEIVKDCL